MSWSELHSLVHDEYEKEIQCGGCLDKYTFYIDQLPEGIAFTCPKCDELILISKPKNDGN